MGSVGTRSPGLSNWLTCMTRALRPRLNPLTTHNIEALGVKIPQICRVWAVERRVEAMPASPRNTRGPLAGFSGQAHFLLQRVQIQVLNRIRICPFIIR